MASHTPPHSSDDVPENLALRAGLMSLATLLGIAAFRALFDYDPTQVPRVESVASDVALFSPTGNAPFFVYAISLWLFYERRHAFFSSLGSAANIPVATSAILGAVAVVAWASHTASPDLLLPGLALCWVGLAATCGGSKAVHAVWLPAVSLIALVPLPAIWIHHLVHPLQLATAEVSVALLHLAGIESVQIADRLIVEQREVFQVIESCSGLRATQTISLSALLYGQIFRRGRLHWLLLFAASPLLGMLVNELRVMSLIFNPYSSFAAVHSAQGLVMLVLGILGVAGVDRVLLRILGTRTPGATPTGKTKSSPVQIGSARIAASAVACSLLLAASFVPPSEASKSMLPWEPADIPIRIAGWKSQPLAVDRVFLGSSRFTEDTFRKFTRNGQEIQLYVGMLNRAARPGAVETPKTVSLGTQRPSRPVEGFTDPIAERGAALFDVATAEGIERVLRWHVGGCDVACEAFRSLLALDRSALRRPGVGYVVRLSTRLAKPTGPDTQVEADARLLGFARRLEASLEKIEVRRLRRAERTEGSSRQTDAGRNQPR